jgi:hypothetical protein
MNSIELKDVMKSWKDIHPTVGGTIFNNIDFHIFKESPEKFVEFYWEEIEGVRLRVFTEEYLKMIRPKCCQSACRHCPWNFKK